MSTARLSDALALCLKARMETKEFEFRPTKEGARSKSPGVIGRLSSFARSKTRHSLNEKTSNSTTFNEKPKKVSTT